MTIRELLGELLQGKTLAEPLEQIPEDALFGVWVPPPNMIGTHAMRLRGDAKFEFESFWDEFTRDENYGEPRLLGEQPRYSVDSDQAEFRFARLRKPQP